MTQLAEMGEKAAQVDPYGAILIADYEAKAREPHPQAIETVRNQYIAEKFPFLDIQLSRITLSSDGNTINFPQDFMLLPTRRSPIDKLQPLFTSIELDRLHERGIHTIGAYLFAQENLALNQPQQGEIKLRPKQITTIATKIQLILENPNLPIDYEGDAKNKAEYQTELVTRASQAIHSFHMLTANNDLARELAKDPKPEILPLHSNLESIPIAPKGSFTTLGRYLRREPALQDSALQPYMRRDRELLKERVKAFLLAEAEGFIPHHYIYKKIK